MTYALQGGFYVTGMPNTFSGHNTGTSPLKGWEAVKAGEAIRGINQDFTIGYDLIFLAINARLPEGKSHLEECVLSSMKMASHTTLGDLHNMIRRVGRFDFSREYHSATLAGLKPLFDKVVTNLRSSDKIYPGGFRSGDIFKIRSVETDPSTSIETSDLMEFSSADKDYVLKKLAVRLVLRGVAQYDHNDWVEETAPVMAPRA